MKKVKHINGIVAPLNRANIDTDLIIPKQFLKGIERHGYGDYLFDSLRYSDGGGSLGQDCSTRIRNPEFSLNHPQYKGATILLTQTNFGCGSSREHAVWALMDYGFEAVVAPSFADIFFNNCCNNGLLPLKLAATDIDELMQWAEANQQPQMSIELDQQTLKTNHPHEFSFDFDATLKHRFLNGLDRIDATLEYHEDITAFEQQHRLKQPWLFNELPP